MPRRPFGMLLTPPPRKLLVLSLLSLASDPPAPFAPPLPPSSSRASPIRDRTKSCTVLKGVLHISRLDIPRIALINDRNRKLRRWEQICLLVCAKETLCSDQFLERWIFSSLRWIWVLSNDPRINQWNLVRFQEIEINIENNRRDIWIAISFCISQLYLYLYLLYYLLIISPKSSVSKNLRAEFLDSSLKEFNQRAREFPQISDPESNQLLS